MNEVFISLGSNLGDSRAYLRAGLMGLRGLEGYQHLGESACYRTAPVGKLDQPAFFNAVAHGRYQGTPQGLLAGLQAIEAAQGRQRLEHWGPRTLDLDLLLFGGLVLEEPDLRLPHPEMWRRAFVLVPLLELAPALVLPVWGKTPGQLLDAMPQAERGLQEVEKVTWA